MLGRETARREGRALWPNVSPGSAPGRQASEGATGNPLPEEELAKPETEPLLGRLSSIPTPGPAALDAGKRQKSSARLGGSRR